MQMFVIVYSFLGMNLGIVLATLNNWASNRLILNNQNNFINWSCGCLIHFSLDIKTCLGTEFLYQHFCMQHFVNQNIFFSFHYLQLSCVKMCLKMCAVDSPSKRHQIMKVIKMFRSCFLVLVKLKLIIHALICYFIRCAFFQMKVRVERMNMYLSLFALFAGSVMAHEVYSWPKGKKKKKQN